MKSYLAGVRPQWPASRQEKHLFLNRWGKGIGVQAVAQVVLKYAKRAGIEKRVSAPNTDVLHLSRRQDHADTLATATCRRHVSEVTWNVSFCPI